MREMPAGALERLRALDGVTGVQESTDGILQRIVVQARPQHRLRDLILEALRTDNGNRQAVAKRLGISPRTLRYKLAKLREAGVEV